LFFPFRKPVDLLDTSKETSVFQEAIVFDLSQPQDLIGGNSKHFGERSKEGAMQAQLSSFVLRNQRLPDTGLFGELDLCEPPSSTELSEPLSDGFLVDWSYVLSPSWHGPTPRRV